MIRISPTFRLSVSVTLMAASLVLVADLLGLFPDAQRTQLAARERICESLAAVLSAAATNSQTELVQQTMNAFVERNTDVRSAAIRRASGEVVVKTAEHDKQWITPINDRSTPTHIVVPVFSGDTRWGAVEVSFIPLDSGVVNGVRHSIWGMTLFVSLLGLGAFYLVLRRALRELDPRGTVPQRIKSAFDALAEGVLILDAQGYIAMANAAFARKSGFNADSLVGTHAEKLEWRDATGESRPEAVPWRRALSEGMVLNRVLLKLVGPKGGALRVFVTNSTPILDDRNRPRGAIVTFDDVTALEKKNEELNTAIEQLREQEREIKRKNEELFELAARDPLTGCLNRRAFFDVLDPLYAKVGTEGLVLSCLMLDIDFFKAVNDRFGHDAGDKVLKWVAETIQSQLDKNGLVCRYGGEEFCVIVPGLGVFQANAVAQQIRRAIEENASIRFGQDVPLTISVGLSSVHFGAKSAANLIHQADQALYAAKGNGRNQVVRWSPEVAAAAQVAITARHRPRPENPEIDVASGGALSTRLAERVEFVEWIEQVLRANKAEGRRLAVVSLVSNQFRRISDTLGATIGDGLLIVISQRLQEQLRDYEEPDSAGLRRRSMVSRLGIDELGLALNDVVGIEGMQRVADALVRVLAHPFEVDGHVVHANIAIGIALTPEGGDTPETLLKSAAAARHSLQELNRNQSYAFYSREMNENSLRRARIVNELPLALNGNQFVLNYQPQQDIVTGETIAWEALLRWPHSEFGLVMPTELIPIAEQTGLIHNLGLWVLRTACMQAQAWSRAGLGAPRVAVNLSAVQLRQPDIVMQVRNVLSETRLEPQRLELEVTESAIMHEPALAQQTLQQLRQLGIRIAIDDFGTGYSGLSYIKNFPADVVKIDRSFLAGVQTDARASKLYEAIVDMARSLNLYIIAEGVEVREDFDFVRRSGCNAIQGYHFGLPMVAEQAEQVMRDAMVTPVPVLDDAVVSRVEPATRR